MPTARELWKRALSGCQDKQSWCPGGAEAKGHVVCSAKVLGVPALVMFCSRCGDTALARTRQKSIADASSSNVRTESAPDSVEAFKTSMARRCPTARNRPHLHQRKTPFGVVKVSKDCDWEPKTRQPTSPSTPLRTSTERDVEPTSPAHRWTQQHKDQLQDARVCHTRAVIRHGVPSNLPKWGAALCKSC